VGSNPTPSAILRFLSFEKVLPRSSRARPCKNFTPRFMSNNISKSNIAKNIKKLRQEKGISQDRLSKLADLSLNTIVNIEAGNNLNPTIETLEKIAKALGVSIDELLKK
jgi:DNA-binding XRE family transcriptional regulator